LRAQAIGDVLDLAQRSGLRLQHEVGHLCERESLFYRPAIARHHQNRHRIHQVSEVEILVPFQAQALDLLPLGVLDDALFNGGDAVDRLLLICA
jgi:hypothetical protein